MIFFLEENGRGNWKTFSFEGAIEKKTYCFVKSLINRIFANDKVKMRRGREVPFFYSNRIRVMIDKDIVRQIVEEKLATSEDYLVEVDVKPGNRIVIEIDNDEGVCIDDCVDLSRYVEEHLDREVEDYELEVGSAGITSPFKVLRQYLKNRGKEVELQLKNGTKLTGILKSADAGGITLTVEKKVKPEGAKRKITVQEDQVYQMDEIKYTKYLIRFK